MRRRLTIYLTDEIADWLDRTSRRSGVPAGRIVREQLLLAMVEREVTEKPFMKLAGIFSGPRNLSTRKGFSRK